MYIYVNEEYIICIRTYFLTSTTVFLFLTSYFIVKKKITIRLSENIFTLHITYIYIFNICILLCTSCCRTAAATTTILYSAARVNLSRWIGHDSSRNQLLRVIPNVCVCVCVYVYNTRITK
jgi:hypothetical protein